MRFLKQFVKVCSLPFPLVPYVIKWKSSLKEKKKTSSTQMATISRNNFSIVLNNIKAHIQKIINYS